VKCNGFAVGLFVLIGLATVTAGCSRPVAAGPRANAKAAKEIRETLLAGAAAPQEGAEATETAAEGWATIKGKFTVSGDVPAPAPLAQPKAVPECSKHKLVDESVIVQNGGLLGAAVFARTPKLPINPDLEKPSGEVILDNKNCRFEPHVVFVQAGQKLSVRNSDPFGHNTKLDANINPSQNFSLPAGGTVEHTFGKEEQQPVKVGCSIHPWMGGWAIVRGNPYGAVSDDTGSFVISKLPAGPEIEFQLWKEKGKSWSGANVEANGESVKLDGKGRFKLKLEPDKDVTLNITVPADALQ
jgi:plastocyanin